MSERTDQLSNLDVLDLVSERLGCDARIETGDMQVWIRLNDDDTVPGEPTLGIWSDILADNVANTTVREAVKDCLESVGKGAVLEWALAVARIVKEEVERFG